MYCSITISKHTATAKLYLLNAAEDFLNASTPVTQIY